MTPALETARYRANWQHEINCATVYWALASTEPRPRETALFRSLAAVEEEHAAFWSERLRVAGELPRPRRCSALAGALSWTARRFGARPVLPVLGLLEWLNGWLYARQTDAPSEFAAVERGHARLLRTMTA